MNDKNQNGSSDESSLDYEPLFNEEKKYSGLLDDE